MKNIFTEIKSRITDIRILLNNKIYIDIELIDKIEELNNMN